ncbi:hypothetical protein ACWD6I_02280 [Streptomyces sp. NPDC002454]
MSQIARRDVDESVAGRATVLFADLCECRVFRKTDPSGRERLAESQIADEEHLSLVSSAPTGVKAAASRRPPTPAA